MLRSLYKMFSNAILWSCGQRSLSASSVLLKKTLPIVILFITTARQRSLRQQISKSILRRMHVVSISNLYSLSAFSILCRFLLQQQRSHEYSYTHSLMSCDNSRRWRKASIFMLLSSIHTVFILFLRSKSDFYSYWTVVFFVSTSLSFAFQNFVCLLQSWQSLKKNTEMLRKNTVWMHIRFRVNWSSVMKKKAFRPDFFSNIHAKTSCFLDHAFHEEY